MIVRERTVRPECMPSQYGMALPPISEELRLADALAGRIRVRAAGAVSPERLHRNLVRAEVKRVLVGMGIPFVDRHSMGLEVKHGMFACFALTEDIAEYVWAPSADVKLRSSTGKIPEGWAK